jgi:L-ascorbate metabolism protein UlaG (beta-lactamase superfamily)
MKNAFFVAIIAALFILGCGRASNERDTALTLNNNTNYFLDNEDSAVNKTAGDNRNITDSQEGKAMKMLGLNIELLGHSSVKMKNRKTIYIDPFQLTEGSNLEKADVILITHEHYDHCSIKDVAKIVKPETIIITVADCQSKLNGLKVKGIALIEPDKSIRLGDDMISAVPAYNINKPYHPKDNHWVGFIIEMDGVKVYHAGDTDLIPEMKDIDVDIALLPVGGTYTMNAKEAAQATKTFKRCKIAIPMHYGSIVGNASDAETFKENAGCEVKILM